MWIAVPLLEFTLGRLGVLVDPTPKWTFRTKQRESLYSVYTLDEKLWSYNVLAGSMSSRCVNRRMSQKTRWFTKQQHNSSRWISMEFIICGILNWKWRNNLVFFIWKRRGVAPFHVLLTSSILVPRFLGFWKMNALHCFLSLKVFWVFRWNCATSHQLFSRWAQYSNELFREWKKKKNFAWIFKRAIAAHGSDTYRQM